MSILTQYKRLFGKIEEWKNNMLNTITKFQENYPNEIISVELLEYYNNNELVLNFKIVVKTENQQLRDNFRDLAKIGNWYCPYIPNTGKTYNFSNPSILSSL